MSIIQCISIASAVICLCSLLVFFIRLVQLGKPNDLSEKSGSTEKGILYSNTTAMLPQNKESAFLHLPAYATGMIFHMGTFLSLLIFILSFFPFFGQWISSTDQIHFIPAILLVITCFCGYILLFRRLCSKNLQTLSHPDDYISNAVTSTFQLFTALYLFFPTSPCATTFYYIFCSILFLYLPLGKLRHVVYYFAARYHLGFFYGWRNVWPRNEN